MNINVSWNEENLSQLPKETKESSEKITCPNCHINPAIIHNLYGVTNCSDCNNKLAELNRTKQPVEMVSTSIKEQRKEFYNDYHPSHRNGAANSEYRDRWGRQAMKNQGFSDYEIDHAKPVYRGSDTYYKN
ncbi:MAG: hypothetical protein ACREQ5_15935 [Candidatus Dormibacteria bacterium]